MAVSSYIPVGQAIRQARMKQDMNQHEFADQLRQGQDSHWNQAKVSRVEIGDRDLTFQEMMRVVDLLGIDALRGTYVLDQILGIVEDRVQSLKTTV